MLLSERQRKMMEGERTSSNIPVVPIVRGVRIYCTFCKYEYTPKSDYLPKTCGACGKEKTLMRKTI